MRARFGFGFAQQPVPDGPKRAGQAEVSPKRVPGGGAIEAVWEPGNAVVVLESQGRPQEPRGGAGVERTDEDVSQNGKRRDGKRSDELLGDRSAAVLVR